MSCQSKAFNVWLEVMGRRLDEANDMEAMLERLDDVVANGTQMQIVTAAASASDDFRTMKAKRGEG